MLDDINWKSTQKIEDIPNDCGVYQICLTDLKEKPIQIDRFCKKDERGILIIGCSDNLRDRLNDFNRAIEKGYGHSEGNRLYLINKVVENCNKIFNSCKLKYEYKVVNGDKKKAEKEEKKLLQDYFKDYGEVPPINQVLPGTKDWIKELRNKENKLSD